MRAFAFFRGFLKERSAVSAVEFALAAPVMITLYFGTVELSDLLMADRKATTLASTAADLVAQDTVVTDAEIQDIFAATTAVLRPFPASGATIVVSSVIADADGNTTVAWSDAYNTSPRAAGSAITMPSGLVLPGGSVILAETSYSYESTTARLISGEFTVNDEFYLRPRRTMQVQRVDD
jgi:Flp pilus assembly protein TadG